MKCPNCAQQIEDDASFCRHCGTTLSPSASPGSTGQPETSGKAIASLVLGLFFFLCPASILAIIFGHMSYSEINRSAWPPERKGHGHCRACPRVLRCCGDTLHYDYRCNRHSQPSAFQDRC